MIDKKPDNVKTDNAKPVRGFPKKCLSFQDAIKVKHIKTITINTRNFKNIAIVTAPFLMLYVIYYT